MKVELDQFTSLEFETALQLVGATLEEIHFFWKRQYTADHYGSEDLFYWLVANVEGANPDQFATLDHEELLAEVAKYSSDEVVVINYLAYWLDCNRKDTSNHAEYFRRLMTRGYLNTNGVEPLGMLTA